VPFWAYSADPPCQKRDFFYTSLHPKVLGSVLFSEGFARRLEREIRLPAEPQEGKSLPVAQAKLGIVTAAAEPLSLSSR